MESGEGIGFVARDNGYYRHNYKKYRGSDNGSRRTSVSAPAAIHVSSLPKIATGRSIRSAKQLWRDHESIETRSAVRERRAREYEDSRHSVNFSKYSKGLQMSRLREMKQFRILHSEVLGMSKAKLKEMYSEVTYLTNAVRNCDGTHSFKNLSTYDQLHKEPIIDHQTRRWQSANQEVPFKRMLPPAPHAEKVFPWDVTTSRDDDTIKSVKSSPLFTIGLEYSSRVNFLEKYGRSNQKMMDLIEKETREKQRRKRRDELLKSTRSNSAGGAGFVIDNTPNVNILRHGYLNKGSHTLAGVRIRPKDIGLHQEQPSVLREKTAYLHERHGSRICGDLIDMDKKLYLPKTNSERREVGDKQNKTTIPVLNVYKHAEKCKSSKHVQKSLCPQQIPSPSLGGVASVNDRLSTNEHEFSNEKGSGHRSQEADLKAEPNNDEKKNNDEKYEHRPTGSENTDNLNNSENNVVGTPLQTMEIIDSEKGEITGENINTDEILPPHEKEIGNEDNLTESVEHEHSDDIVSPEELDDGIDECKKVIQNAHNKAREPDEQIALNDVTSITKNAVEHQSCDEASKHAIEEVASLEPRNETVSLTSESNRQESRNSIERRKSVSFYLTPDHHDHGAANGVTEIKSEDTPLSVPSGELLPSEDTLGVADGESGVNKAQTIKLLHTNTVSTVEVLQTDYSVNASEMEEVLHVDHSANVSTTDVSVDSINTKSNSREHNNNGDAVTENLGDCGSRKTVRGCDSNNSSHDKTQIHQW